MADILRCDAMLANPMRALILINFTVHGKYKCCTMMNSASMHGKHLTLKTVIKRRRLSHCVLHPAGASALAQQPSHCSTTPLYGEDERRVKS